MALAELSRYPHVAASVYFGATCNYPPEWQHTADALVTSATEYRNPHTEHVYDQLHAVCEQRSVHAPRLKSDLGVKKAQVITYFASFADSHRLPLHPIYEQHSAAATALVERIEASEDKPLSISEQLNIALDVSDSDLTIAVTTLALATRAVGRGMDTRIVPHLSVSPERMKNWETCVSQFPDSDTADAVGDTYHFWHGVHAGMSVGEHEKRKEERTKVKVCKRIYKNTARATEFLRYQLTPERGRVHRYVDRLGYEIGVGLVYQFQ